MQTIISYIRVSTDQQGRSGLGIEAQREAVARFADLEGFEITKQEGLAWYESSATSRRGFCEKCGSSLFFDHGPDEPIGVAKPPVRYALAAGVFATELSSDSQRNDLSITGYPVRVFQQAGNQ